MCGIKNDRIKILNKNSIRGGQEEIVISYIML